MLKNVISSVEKVDYLTFEVDEDVDIIPYLEGNGYGVDRLSTEDFINLVDDEDSLDSNSKHQRWNRPKMRFGNPRTSDRYDSGPGITYLKRFYRKVSVSDRRHGHVSFLLDLGGDRPKTNAKITLRSDMVNGLTFTNIKKLLADLRDVSTITRIDLAKDLHFKSSKDLSDTFMDITKDLHEDPDKGYFGKKNKDNPIRYKGLLANVKATYYIGNEDELASIRFYNPLGHGISVRSDMYNELRSHYNLSIIPEIKEVFDTFEESMGEYIRNYMGQFHILRADITLKGDLAKEAADYIIDSDGEEHEVVGELIEETSVNYFKS